MNFDGLTMKLLVNELKEKCENSQINKILQIDKLTLLLRLSTSEGLCDLIITMGNTPSIYITSPLHDLPKAPSALCMFLRKHIESSRITKVEQINDDRIIKITADRINLAGDIETKQIYIEIMGKHSNCIFVENGIILESLKHVSPFMSQERQIQPKLKYSLPPNAERMSVGDFDAITINQMFEMHKDAPLFKVIRLLFNGFGNPILKELELLSGISKNTIISEISSDDLLKFSELLLEKYTEISNSKTLYFYQLPSGKKVYSPIKLEHLESKPEEIHAISPILEESIKNNGSIGTTKQKLENIIKAAITKEKKRYSKIESELDESNSRDLYKKYADLLMIYAYMPDSYQSSITVVDCLDENQNNITIPLKPELTLAQNGQGYYKRYHRLKNRLIHSQEQLDLSIEKTNYLESILFALNNVSSKNDLQEIELECQEYGLIKKAPRHMQQKPKQAKPLTINVDGARIVIGQNNKQNEYITHKLAQPFDMWFHTKDYPGSHVILQADFEPDESLLEKAASYAAYFSKGRESSYVVVDYTLIKNVKKVPNTPLGFVTYKNQHSLNVKPINPLD